MFFKNYLINRKQRVIYNSNSSSTIDITSGVPQGSPLSPLLFNIYFNDFVIKPPVETVKYADDTTIIIPNFSDTHTQGEHEKKQFENWCQANKLKLNINKTQIMTIDKKNNENKQHKSIKILGMWIQSTLKWDENINEIVKRCSSRLYLLRKVAPILDKKHKITLYCGLIQSIIDYGCPVYGKLKLKHKQKFDRIIKRAHFIICQKTCDKECLTYFSTRQQQLSTKLFAHIESNKNHILHHFIPAKLPRTKQYTEEYAKTSRRRDQFFPYIAHLMNSPN